MTSCHPFFNHHVHVHSVLHRDFARKRSDRSENFLQQSAVDGKNFRCQFIVCVWLGEIRALWDNKNQCSFIRSAAKHQDVIQEVALCSAFLVLVCS